MHMPADVSAVWKWVAAILATILLAGAPGMVYALKSPSQADVKLIRDRQDDVRIRLSVVEAQLRENALVLQQLRDEIQTHVRTEGSR